MPTPRVIHVFIASPGDLAVERQAFKEVIDDLNGGFGDGAGVKFVPLGWEDTLASTGPRAQDVINCEIDKCDVFILAMHRHWGRKASNVKPYLSFTEEEYYRAWKRWEKEGKPNIFVFFKKVDSASMADPGAQLKKVLKFRKQLEKSQKVLYHLFDDETEFKKKVDRHLRSYARGDLPKPNAPHEGVPLPADAIEEITKAKAEAVRVQKQMEREHKVAEAALARAEALALDLAEHAAKAALEGRVEEARQSFAKAHQSTTSLRILYLAYEYYDRTGDFGAAEELLERWLALSGRDADSTATAAAFGNLGLIYQKRGDLDRAEEMHQKSLAINEKLGHQEGMAIQYGNLGVIYQTRGDLGHAEELLKKALAIEEKLDRQEGIAADYDNLGLIYQTRGNLECAEEMHKKSVAIHEKLGHQEGMARAYGNLGLIYQRRGDLDRAEEMLKKSLAISEKLGRQEGMANQYGNLGVLQEKRGQVAQARELWIKARDLYAKIGMPHMVKMVQGWLDTLPKPK